MSFRDPTALGLQMRAAMPSFYVGDGNANSGPHAPVADPFLTETSFYFQNNSL